MALLAASILPAWLVIPVAAVALFATAIHVVAMQGAAVPPGRKRIRTGIGLTMMLITTLFAYGVGIARGGVPDGATPHQTRIFVLVWLAIIVLVAFAVLLAIIDGGMTFRHAAAERKRLRREMGLQLRGDLEEFPSAAKAKGATGSSGAGSRTHE